MVGLDEGGHDGTAVVGSDEGTAVDGTAVEGSAVGVIVEGSDDGE